MHTNVSEANVLKIYCHCTYIRSKVHNIVYQRKFLLLSGTRWSELSPRSHLHKSKAHARTSTTAGDASEGVYAGRSHVLGA
jgi:hypothetical protein